MTNCQPLLHVPLPSIVDRYQPLLIVAKALLPEMNCYQTLQAVMTFNSPLLAVISSNYKDLRTRSHLHVCGVRIPNDAQCLRQDSLVTQQHCFPETTAILTDNSTPITTKGNHS